MIEIRRAELEDAPAIAEVHVAVWKTAYCGLMPEEVFPNLSVAQRTERWRSTIPYEPVGTFVALVDGEVVGFCSAGEARDEDCPGMGEVYAIYVLETAAGNGLGSKLIFAAETWMTERGYGEAVLWVLASNVNARGFYKARWWVDDSKTKTEMIQGFAIVEARYRKRIGLGGK